MFNLNWNNQEKAMMRTGQTYQIFKEEIKPFPHNVFPKIEGKGLSTSQLILRYQHYPFSKTKIIVRKLSISLINKTREL